MRRVCLLVISLLMLGIAAAADLPLKPFSYHEDFETTAPPVTLWASRGSAPTINFLGLSDEQAFAGKKSLKLDLTLGDSPYYYFGAPLRIPLSGKLALSARIRLGQGNQARVGFGVNVNYPPTTHSGCGPWETYTGTTDWKLVEGDLSERAQEGANGVIPRHVAGVTGRDVAIVLDRWAIFITGSPGQRAIVYLDDVKIEGQIPDLDPYLKDRAEAFTAAQARFRQDILDWDKQLAERRAALPDLKPFEPIAPAFVASVRQSEQHAIALLADIQKRQYASPQDVQSLHQEMASLAHVPDAVKQLQAAQAAGRQFVVYGCAEPTTSVRTPGSAACLIGTAAPTLTCAACPGEYESVSLSVWAMKDLSAVRVSCGDLKGERGSIPAASLDFRVVKSWYQGASSNIGFTPQKWLIPELLLKDDKLVRVDTATQTNYLRSTAADGTETYLNCTDPDSSGLANVRPVDAKALQPINIPSGESREFWLTIHLPKTAAPGSYRGSLELQSSGGSYSVPLQVTVHPFELQPSRLTYSIYYRASIAKDGQPHIDSEKRSEAQYRAEMADLLAHGVLYPTNYTGPDEELLRKELQIRQEVGLPGGRFYNLGRGINVTKPEELPKLREDIKWWLALLKPWGYTEVYFYGADEATGDRLTAQKAAWGMVQEAGGKTFVACYKKTFEAMGKLLNTAVLAGPPDPEEAAKYHSVGSEAFCYANPQVGVEDPLVYRRNFGLVLWKAGFDGAMDYAYQHGFGHVWNDFDSRSYRDHNFTYPTVDGIVPTIAWEGFREAVDDVRYVTTLEKVIACAPATRRKAADDAKAFLTRLDPSRANPDQTRREIVTWILKLR